jgi:polyphenol oxidase
MKFEYDESLGWKTQFNNNLFLFGHRRSDMDHLRKSYPELEFRRLHQVHDATLVESSSGPSPKADAHWTANPHIALVVATADCLPVLVSHPQFICAIHAGWRGVHNEIAAKSLSRLFDLHQDQTHQAVAAIGPHIMHESFEVDLALAEDFCTMGIRLGLTRDQVFLDHKSNSKKAYINLSLIMRHQLIMTGIPAQNIHEIAVDTVRNDWLHSYRREKASPGRNFSFVARLK